MKIICVSGADGCGKSTLLTSLAEALPGASVVSIWDLMRDPRARPLYATKEQIQTFLGALEEESRALFMLSYLRAAMDRAAPGVVLVDAYWYKYLANELALGAAPARLLPLTALFEKPMLTIHLELGPAIAAARKQGCSLPTSADCGLRPPSTSSSSSRAPGRSRGSWWNATHDRWCGSTAPPRPSTSLRVRWRAFTTRSPRGTA